MKKIYNLFAGIKMPRLINPLPSIMLKGLLAVCLFMLSFNVLCALGTVTGPTIVCVGATDQYCYSGTATGALTYTWHVSSGGSYSPTTPGCISVTWNAAGTDSVWVNVYNSSTCMYEDSAIAIITVNPLPLAQIFTYTSQSCVTLRNGTIGKDPGLIMDMNQNLSLQQIYSQINSQQNMVIGSSPASKGDTCYLVCDSTAQVFYTNAGAATYSWSVTGPAGVTISTSGSTTNIFTVFWGGIAAIGDIAEVKLVITTAAGCADSSTQCVEIIQKPVCNFYGDTVACGGTLNICKGQTVTFRDSSLGSSQSPINSWLWNFGDNTTSTNPDPTHQYNTAGTYTVKLIVTNACGCKDSCELTVIVDSTTGPNIYCPTTICAGDTGYYWTDAICSSYSWSVSGGTIITDSTRDTIRVVWGNGNSGPGIISVSTPLCGTYCPYANYVTVPIVPLNGVIFGPTNVCADGSKTIRYNMNCIPGTSYSWSLSPAGFGYIPSPSDGSEQGIIWYGLGTCTINVSYYNSLLGCGGTASLVVNINSPYQLNSPPTSVCAGDTSVFTTIPGGMFKWIVYDNLTNIPLPDSADATSFTQIWPQVTTVTTYTVFCIDTIGVFCNSPQFVTVTVYPLPQTPGPIAGISCVCPNESYTYSATATSGGYLQWTVINGSPASAVGSSINVTWGSTGPYVLLLQQGMIASPHCLSIADTDTVFVCAPITGVISGLNSVCINFENSYTFPAGASEYFWSLVGANSTFGSIVSGQNTNTATIQWGNNIGPVTIQVKYTLCGISDSATFVVNVTAPPVPVIVGPATVCAGTPVTFTTTATSCNSTWTWSINGGPPVTTPTGSYTTTFTTSGIYTITLVVEQIGCCILNGNATTSITVNPIPDVGISTPSSLVECAPSLPITFYLTITNTGCVGTATQQWYGPGGALGTAATQASGTVFPTAYGNYYCVVTNSCGCSATTNILQLDTCTPPPPPCPISPAPSVSFTFVENCGTVTFTETNSALNFVAGSYYWDFGDGTTVSGVANPTHTYTQAKYYNVTFCCDYFDGVNSCTICTTKTDTVPLLPNFYAEYTCSGSGPILTTLIDNSQHIATYAINTINWVGVPIFGSGSPISAIVPAGLYLETEQVTVVGYANTCPITLPITVPVLPVAGFTVNRDTICSGDSIKFTNTSTNPGAIVQYSWNFNDLSGSNLENPVKTYNITGTLPHTFNVTLTITDEWGCTSTFSKTVKVYPNTITIHPFDFPDSIACQGDTIIIDANAHSHYGIASYSWIPCGHYTEFDSVTQTGWYIVMVTDSVGCSAIDSAQATFLDIPTPSISGTQNYCYGSNINLSMYVGPSYTYAWTISNPLGGPTTVSSSDLNFSNYPALYNYLTTYPTPIPIIVTGYISVSTPVSCVDSAIDTIWAYPQVPAPTITDTNNCLKNAPLTLTATDPASPVIFNWSTGANGSTISVINSGIYVVTATDTFGCSNQSYPIVIPALPNFCDFFTGCICDTGNQVIMAPNDGSHVVGWLRNDTLIAGSVGSLTITLPGAYQIILENTPGCPDTSGFIYADNCAPVLCCCCDSSVVYFKSLVCIGLDSSGNEQYQYDIYYDYTGSSSTSFTVTIGPPNNGTLSGMTSGTLYPGINSITGIFTDITPVGYNFCLEIIHGDSATGGSCKQEVCSSLPPCDSLPPCNQKVCVCDDCGGIICGGDDINGNPIYKIFFYINYTGSNNSTFYISSAEGTFSSLTSNIVNNGFNQYSVMFVNLPPWQGYMCMNVVIRDSLTGIVCEQQYCFALPECPVTPCQSKPIQQIKADCMGIDSTGHQVYFVSAAVPDPFPCCGQSVAVVSSTGFISNQAPTILSGPMTIVTFDYTNYSTDSTNACFRFIITDSSGAQCMDSACVKLPKCQNPNLVLSSSYFTIQPNPARDKVVVNYKFTQAGDNDIVFRDARGVEMGRIRVNNNEGSFTYDVSSISAGVYQVSSENNNKRMQTLRFIITK